MDRVSENHKNGVMGSRGLAWWGKKGEKRRRVANWYLLDMV